MPGQIPSPVESGARSARKPAGSVGDGPWERLWGEVDASISGVLPADDERRQQEADH